MTEPAAKYGHTEHAPAGALSTAHGALGPNGALPAASAVPAASRGLDDNTHKALVEEFKEAGLYHRLHVTLMFGQITVFLGASGGLLHRLTTSPKLDPLLTAVLALFGALISYLFLVLHERVYTYSMRARDRASSIQPLLGLDLYRYEETRWKWGRGHASTWTRALYVAALVVWMGVFAWNARGAIAPLLAV
jgi:hypothetical protein